MNIYLGIDNGASGSVGMILKNPNGDEYFFFETPVKHEQDYTKKDSKISRLDVKKLKDILLPYRSNCTIRAIVERPFMTPITTVEAIDKKEIIDEIITLINGIGYTHPKDLITFLKSYKSRKIVTADVKFLKTSLNAHRFYEATLLLLDSLQIGYETADSKAWQKVLIPGIKGSAKLKDASKSKASQMYPELTESIKKHKDGDGILIARFAEMYYNGS